MAPALSVYEISEELTEFKEGILFGLEVELRSFSNIKFYEHAPLGWSVCPLGYNVFKFPLSGRQIAIPGLIIPEFGGKRRKFPDYKLVFQKNL